MPHPGKSPARKAAAKAAATAMATHAGEGGPSFPSDALEREVSDRLQASCGGTLPHDMLFGFVRGNRPGGKKGNSATEWFDTSAAQLMAALELLAVSGIDRGVQPPQLAQPAGPTPAKSKRRPSREGAPAGDERASEPSRRTSAPADGSSAKGGSSAEGGVVEPAQMRVFDQCWSWAMLGEDNTGHVAVVDRVGSVDFDTMLSNMSIEEMMACYAARLERLRRRKLALAESKGAHAYFHTMVFDLRGLRFGGAKRDRRLVQDTIKYASVVFPETLYKMYLVNCPSVFPLIWRIVRPFIEDDTRQKIEVIGGHAAQRVRDLSGLDIRTAAEIGAEG